ncbi:beta-galactosidase-like isoform X2 [Condylostylus longicornis]|uniref:beta-galactosidase-like isoform X2 n=1 Tax=Condylostylus longicornis TaxID=2530218 RepID=UPI00244DFC43|nr:beta-galactosidase-like isoform X2 [Condylostylus longicornis]
MVRSFTIDYKANKFLMDGKEFRYVAGSFHYFRALPNTWRAKLRTMRAAGLNAVDTYVEWSLHNPEESIYNFNEIANVERFIQIAQEEDLYVILRPGPYICAERDNGGLPYWLFSKYPNIKMRTSDSDYLNEIKIWYSILMPKMEKYLYGNGGPIIMVQVENEYGAFPACDKKYLEWLRDETKKYIQNKAILFTTDIPDETISCGKIDGVFATTDFGADRVHEMDQIWKTLRTVQPNGPLVNSEFYPGWLTHWQEENQRRDPDVIANALRDILKTGASVNIYMFFGGTNFGFTAGANDWGPGNYTADITSYDYDAPMDESGDPTLKYHKIREVISEFLPLPNIPVPEISKKMSFKPIPVTPIVNLFTNILEPKLFEKTVESKNPKGFEELNHGFGFMAYETKLPNLKIDPTILTINGLHDRAQIYIDNNFIGTLSRDNNIKYLPISAGSGEKLQILVENQGRINFHDLNDRKGILGNVTIQGQNGVLEELHDWTSKSIPLKSDHLENIFEQYKNSVNPIEVNKNGLLLNGPSVFVGNLIIEETSILDTYIDFSGWGKGVAFVNFFNIGRYWPLVGPQITLYVPKELLKTGSNPILIVELEKVPNDRNIRFTDTPKLDG